MNNAYAQLKLNQKAADEVSKAIGSIRSWMESFRNNPAAAMASSQILFESVATQAAWEIARTRMQQQDRMQPQKDLLTEVADWIKKGLVDRSLRIAATRSDPIAHLQALEFMRSRAEVVVWLENLAEGIRAAERAGRVL